MSGFDIFIFLLMGAVGVAFGLYCILIVVMRKPEVKAVSEGKMPFPLNLGRPLSRRVGFLWFGIVWVIFSCGLIFAVIQENFLK